MKITKKRYLQSFGLTVVLLAIVRAVFPEVADNCHDAMRGSEVTVAQGQDGEKAAAGDSVRAVDEAGVRDEGQKGSGGGSESGDKTTQEARVNMPADADALVSPLPAGTSSRFFNPDGTLVKSRIYSVPHFGNAFPDQNDVQMEAAKRHGVKAVQDRADAERRKSELVYVGYSPFYHVDKLKSSIPYLVPCAAELLQDIGRNYFDSLQVKQIPLHKIIVTSVLRSKEDIVRLRRHNGNATENSCHLYGTTFDVCYNRYVTVEDPDGPKRRAVRNDTLKWVLSEVLDDLRQSGRCLVKYEVKQGCFHITVK